MKIHRKILILVVMLFAAIRLQAQTLPIDQSHYNQPDWVLDGKYFDILVDTSQTIGIKQIISPEVGAKMKPDGRKSPNIQNLYVPIWMRLTFRNDGKPEQPRLLEVIDSHIGRAWIYVVYPDGSIDSSKAGAEIPFMERPYSHKNLVFDMDFKGNKQIKVYIKVISGVRNTLLLNYRTTRAIIGYTTREYFLLGLYYGVLLIMMIYNLFLYITIRERLYSYLVSYIIGCVSISFMEDGLGFQFLWQSSPHINYLLYQYASLGVLIAFFLFSRRFLSLQTELTLINRILNAVVGIYTVAFLFNHWVYFYYWSYTFSIIPFLVIYGASVWLTLKGKGSARYFALGFSVVFFQIVYGFLEGANLVPPLGQIFKVYSFNIGVVVQIVSFSYALAHRLRSEVADRNRAQESVIAHLRENQELKDNLNRELEKRVLERTSEIAASNSRLADALQQVQDQAAEIKELNQLLNQENTGLKTNLKEMAKAWVRHRELDMNQFTTLFKDAQECYQYLADLKWSQGFNCKKCHYTKYCEGKDPLSRRCTRCRYEESPTTGTIFHKLRFPVQKAFLLLFLVHQRRHITTQELSDSLDLRQKTCWAFRKRIDDVWKEMLHLQPDAKLAWDDLIIHENVEVLEE